jgi:hypothetical protein
VEQCAAESAQVETLVQKPLGEHYSFFISKGSLRLNRRGGRVQPCRINEPEIPGQRQAAQTVRSTSRVTVHLSISLLVAEPDRRRHIGLLRKSVRIHLAGKILQPRRLYIPRTGWLFARRTASCENSLAPRGATMSGDNQRVAPGNLLQISIPPDQHAHYDA